MKCDLISQIVCCPTDCIHRSLTDELVEAPDGRVYVVVSCQHVDVCNIIAPKEVRDGRD